MSKEIAEARKTMRDALKDEDLSLAYVSNIAMLLYDRYNEANFSNTDTRNQAAEEILMLIFDSE